MAEVTLPTNYLDWKSKQMSTPLNGAPNQREPNFAAEEPHYLLVRSDQSSPRHMGIIRHLVFWKLFLLNLDPQRRIDTHNFFVCSKLEHTN